MFDEHIRHNIFHLAFRLASSAIRILSISLLFNFDGTFARDVLFILSSIYLFQVISGLEIYLDPNLSNEEHLSKIIHTGLLFSPLIFFYFWFNDFPLLWVLFFLLDYVLVEISRKSNVSYKVLESNKIAFRRACFFFLATFTSFYYQDYFVLTLTVCTSVEVLLQLYRSDSIIKIPIKNLFKNLSLMAILLTITNRSIDLAIRSINQSNNGFIYEYWDFFLSIFGLTTTVTFYLFIVSHSKDILENKIRIPLRVYILQPFVIFISIFVSLVYFWIINGSVGLDVKSSRVIIEIYFISLIMALFQVHNWTLLASRKEKNHGNANIIFISITALTGLVSAFIVPSEYVLYPLMAMLLIMTIFGIRKGANNVRQV